MTDVPHLALPVRFTGTPPRAAVVEQDTRDDIAQCVEVIVRCPLGHRIELPAFGIADLAFTTSPQVGVIDQAITDWEPRAQALTGEELDRTDPALRRIVVALQERSHA